MNSGEKRGGVPMKAPYGSSNLFHLASMYLVRMSQFLNSFILIFSYCLLFTLLRPFPLLSFLIFPFRFSFFLSLFYLIFFFLFLSGLLTFSRSAAGHRKTFIRPNERITLNLYGPTGEGGFSRFPPTRNFSWMPLRVYV